jgi:hypothetical protein
MRIYRLFNIERCRYDFFAGRLGRLSGRRLPDLLRIGTIVGYLILIASAVHGAEGAAQDAAETRAAQDAELMYGAGRLRCFAPLSRD